MISTPLSWKSLAAEFVGTPELSAEVAVALPPVALDETLEHHRALGSPIVSIDLQPLEKNFFTGVAGTNITPTLIKQYFERVQQQGEERALAWLTSHLLHQPEYHEYRKNSKTKLALVKAEPQRISFFQSPHYDYYQELVAQYQLLKERQPEWSEWIYTIQGLHALGAGNEEASTADQSPFNASRFALKSRIRQLKGEEAIEGTQDYWQHAPMAIALAGHFHNTVCGHTSSLPEASRLVYDQRNGKDLAFLQEGAYDIIYELLGLDENLRPTGATRIAIDVRHMSPAARKVYYQNIIARFNEQPANRDRKIPIIATNVSGVDSLDELMRQATEGKEKDHNRSNGFLSWGYNLCDEDVIAIFNSRGLINIANDKRLLGEDYSQWLAQIDIRPLAKRRAHQLLKRTIEQFVRIAFDYFLANPLKIWDVIGFYPSVSPVEPYPADTLTSWDTVEEDLLEVLTQLKREEPLLFGNYRPEDIVRKMCVENVQRVIASLKA
jgi:hypothetical protein